MNLRLPAAQALPYAQLTVAAYRVMGFAVLTAILVGMVSYLGINVFFLVSTRWILPAIVSPTDERVLALRSQIAQHAALRAKLVAERELADAGLRDARRRAAVQTAFAARARAAVEAEIADLSASLGKLGSLVDQHRTSEASAATASDALADYSREQLEIELRARVIDRDEYIRGQYQLAQIADTRVSMAGRNLELERERRAVEREIAALRSLLEAPAEFGSGRFDDSLTPEVLVLAQELALGELERQRSVDGLATADASFDAIDTAIQQFDDLLASLENSAYLEALDKKLTVAFVPYENLEDIGVRERLFGCHLGVLACVEVGEIVRILEGEVMLDHPLGNDKLRGRMVQVDIDEPEWAQEKVLFTGRAAVLW